MKIIHIKTPIWNGLRVGIGAYIKDDIQITIGHERFPETYRMSWDELKEYPVNTLFGKGVPVRTPAIADFHIVPRETFDCPHHPGNICTCDQEANDTIKRNEAQAAGNAVPTRPFPCVHEALLRREDNDYECAGCGQLFNMMISLRIGG